MYIVEKINKRLWITNSGERIYTPPEFVVMLSRNNLQEVADQFNLKKEYDILAVIKFESDFRFRRDYRKNKNYVR